MARFQAAVLRGLGDKSLRSLRLSSVFTAEFGTPAENAEQLIHIAPTCRANSFRNLQMASVTTAPITGVTFPLLAKARIL